MIKIQVLGKGMIPRGLGLAPRKEFFNADLTLINTILSCNGLKVNMLSPIDNKIIPVTRANVKKLWDKYRSDVIKPTKTPIVTKDVNAGGIAGNVSTPVIENLASKAPVVETPKVTPVIKEEKRTEVTKVEEKIEPKVEDKKSEEKVEQKVEQKSEAPAVVKPVINNNQKK